MNQFSKLHYNLCVVGDEVVCGYGDDTFSGIFGRVLKSVGHDVNILLHNLGRPNATSVEISKSLESNLEGRFINEPDDSELQQLNRLVILMPSRDIDHISSSRARLNLANMLDKPAYTSMRALVLGPAPRNLDDGAALAELNEALQDVCMRRNVQYVDLYNALKDNKQWIGSMLASDGKYPDQAGYALIAWVVQHSDFEAFLKG